MLKFEKFYIEQHKFLATKGLIDTNDVDIEDTALILNKNLIKKSASSI